MSGDDRSPKQSLSTRQLNGKGTNNDNDELARFREAWRAEVKHRKQLGQGGSSALPAEDRQERPLKNVMAPSLGGFTPLGYAPVISTAQSRSHAPGDVQASGTRTSVLAQTKTNFTPTQTSAIDLYSKAVVAEQAGDLDNALQLYRSAFRMYDAVDRLWRTAESQATNSPQSLTAANDNSVIDHTKTKGIETIAAGMQALSTSDDAPASEASDKHERLVQHALHTASVTGTLKQVMANFPAALSFVLEEFEYTDPTKLTWNDIPDELVVHILCKLTPAQVERFARVCRKARAITVDGAIWRTFVERIYKPPQITPDETCHSVMMRKGIHDYRQFYQEQPRVRLDGVYIAVCHYIRNGLHDNPWINISHLVTYHRYLRFFPNGQVLSLLANEQEDPQHLIKNIGLSLQMKGLSLGTWHIVEGPSQPGKSPNALVYIDNLLPREGLSDQQLRYHFQMTLSLRSRPLGRWNKLDFVQYASVSLGSGESSPFPLKHERPFWFSKVRSYGSGEHMEEMTETKMLKLNT